MKSRFIDGNEYPSIKDYDLRIAESEIAQAASRDGFVSIVPNYNEKPKMKHKKPEISWFRFGNGLKAVAAHIGANAHTIYRGDEQIAKTSISPYNSYEDSGLFLCDVDGGEHCRFMDGEGVFCFKIYGKHTGPFHNGYARVEKADGSFDFIDKKGRELGFELLDATNFVYEEAGEIMAEVKFKGAKHKCFINPKGKVVNTERYGSQDYLDELEDMAQNNQ